MSSLSIGSVFFIEFKNCCRTIYKTFVIQHINSALDEYMNVLVCVVYVGLVCVFMYEFLWSFVCCVYK